MKVWFLKLVEVQLNNLVTTSVQEEKEDLQAQQLQLQLSWIHCTKIPTKNWSLILDKQETIINNLLHQ